MVNDIQGYNGQTKGYNANTEQMMDSYFNDIVSLSELRSSFTALEINYGFGALFPGFLDHVEQLHWLAYNTPAVRKSLVDNPQICKDINVNYTDGVQFPYKSHTFDRIFALNGLHVFTNPTQACSDIYHALLPNGWFIMLHTRPMNVDTLMGNLASQDDIIETLKSTGFAQIDIKTLRSGFPMSTAQTFFDDLIEGSLPLVTLPFANDVEAAARFNQQRQVGITNLKSLINPGYINILTTNLWLLIAKKSV